jgi:hypothetical protein
MRNNNREKTQKGFSERESDGNGVRCGLISGKAVVYARDGIYF